MTRAEVTVIVEQAVQRLIDEQPALLDLDVTERALSHHLAMYIAASVPAGLD
jgi:hypothetical protein